MPKILWQPDAERIRSSNLARFCKQSRLTPGGQIDYGALHRMSVDQPERFWPAVWDFCGVRAQTRGETPLADGGSMRGARFFPQARLNFAENILRGDDGFTAIIFQPETGDRMSWTMG
ncbi:Acetoacetyl-CoA synthetase, partial [hydrothermal vent metagenome]